MSPNRELSSLPFSVELVYFQKPYRIIKYLGGYA